MKGARGRGQEGGWKGTWGQVVKGPVGGHTPSLWLPKQFLCARCPWQLCQAPWAPVQVHLPSLQRHSTLPQAWLSQAAVGVCQRLCPPSLDDSQELQEPAQRCQEGGPGRLACALWAWTDWEGYLCAPALHCLPALSNCARIWVRSVCCCLSQSSYYG